MNLVLCTGGGYSMLLFTFSIRVRLDVVPHPLARDAQRLYTMFNFIYVSPINRFCLKMEHVLISNNELHLVCRTYVTVFKSLYKIICALHRCKCDKTQRYFLILGPHSVFRGLRVTFSFSKLL